MIRLLVALFFAGAAFAQADPEFVRMWEEAQRARPRNITSIARIAPPKEPGPPLVVHGRVLHRDGKPIAGVTVFAYQTDNTGVYNRANARGWRLRGWARTDAQGRFTFHTIRPAPYPNRTTPAHIHFSIEGADVPRRWTNELRFADDPLLPARERRDAATVTTRGGVQHVEFTIRIEERGKF